MEDQFASEKSLKEKQSLGVNVINKRTYLR